ncbi:protein SAR DEFICIENT 1-like isoform X2 [Carex rostrata]
MEAEMLHDGSGEDQDTSREHQMRRLSSLPKEIRQMLAFNSLQNSIVVTLEPRLHELVREEVERALSHIPWNLERQSQMQITSSPEAPQYQLTLKNPPKTPIFAGAKIRDCEGNPLQILLVVGPTRSPCYSPSPIKIELVVLDGDFPSHDDWTRNEFEQAIVKERTGRKPLLTGDVSNITMRGGVAMIGDFQFTDNSSWIRSRHFRIGVRVVSGSNHRSAIKETVTERFTVKDHRGELYRKHYPPVLTDEVWRLEKIAKDGAFHIKLSENNINNIQDFLKLQTVDASRLRHILNNMPKQMWEKVNNHASTCNLGDKIYLCRGQDVAIFVNSICQVVRITINGIPFAFKDLTKNYKDYVQLLIREAYEQWDNLMEVDEFDADDTLIQSQCMRQGGVGPVQWYPNSSQDSGVIEFIGDADEGSSSSSFQFDQIGSMDWSHDFNQMP